MEMKIIFQRLKSILLKEIKGIGVCDLGFFFWNNFKCKKLMSLNMDFFFLEGKKAGSYFCFFLNLI